jgi:predicted nucleotidyltransferase
VLEIRSDVPEPHAAFLRRALEPLRADARLVGVAAGGSYLTGTMDEFSDLDLVLAVEAAAYPEVMEDRHHIAAALGPLLSAFTGEHVGEPRVLICLYGPPLLHVDLKFVAVADAAQRVEDPAVLWERDGRLTAALGVAAARYPARDLQWLEDRFWVWVHYGAGKIGRGELFETHDLLAALRAQVLGPLMLQTVGARPSGVRHLEQVAPGWAQEMQATVARYEPRSCAAALREAAQMYRALRGAAATPELVVRKDAEAAAMAYLDDILARMPRESP